MISIDIERCNGCGECVAVCPSGALYLVDDKATVDAVLCSNCESCIAACLTGAILCAEPAMAAAIEPPHLPALRLESEPVRVVSHEPAPWWARVPPAMGAALVWAGREIVPRLAEGLLYEVDRWVLTKRRTPAAREGSGGDASRTGRGGGRRHRYRRGR